MKDKKILLILSLGALLLVGIAIYVLSSRKSSPKPVVQPAVTEESMPQVLTLTPEELGLSLTAGAGNKKVIMKITNTQDISLIEYQLAYTSKGGIPRGAIGQLDVKTPGKPATQEITLGTCSDVCHYDQDVSGIKLTLKITKTNGKIYQSEKTLDL